MTAMGWFITADVGEFLAEAGEFLRAEPARNSVVLTVTENLRITAATGSPAAVPGSGPDEPLFGWWRPPVDERLGYRGLTLWEADGVSVSLAGLTRTVAGMVRVGPVYTPPELRGRGYASAATVTVSQAALNAGVREVVLYTDLANPTSNALYQRLGYRPVEDRVVFSFSRARRGLRFTCERTRGLCPAGRW